MHCAQATALLTIAFITTVGTVSMTAYAAGNMTGRLDHPCTLVNVDMLTRLRAAAEDTTPNRFGFSTGEVWQELIAQADRFLVAEPYTYSVVIPAGYGGDGTPWTYTLSDATPPRHDESPNYPPWTAMTQEQRDDAITVRLKTLSAAYLITGERKYADRAKRIAMNLANWDVWSDPSYTGGRIKACLDTGHITKCVGLFYDWCYDTLTEAERAKLRDAIVKKGIEPSLAYVGHYPPETNGYAVITAGVACAAVALRPDTPDAGEYLEQAIELTKVSFDMCGEDGGLFEGPMYGTYLMDNFAHVLDAITAAEIDSDLFDHPFLATMPFYTISNMTPDGRDMPCYGDGSPVRGFPETMSILAVRGSTDAAWYLDQIGAIRPRTIHEFLRFDAELLNPVQPAWNPSRPFVDIGYAILRDGYAPHRPFLAMKSGPFDTNIGHNHYDHNAIVISHMGEWIITDRGYRDRSGGARTKFSQGSIGHATMVMDIDDGYMYDEKHPSPGHDQVHKTGGLITKYFSCEVLDYAQGQAASAYNTDDLTVLSSFTRDIIYLKPHVFVMVDQIESPTPRSYNVLLQAGTQSVCRQVDGNAWTIEGGRSQLHCWFTGAQPLQTDAQAYPGAESYGQFLRAYTAKLPEARIISVLQPAPFGTGSLIRNSGFEADMQGWTPRANDDLPNHVIDAEVKRSGDFSGRIDRSGYYYSPKVSVEPGTELRAEAWLRTRNTTEGGGYMAIHFFGPSKCIQTVSGERATPQDWMHLQLDAVAPEGTLTACIGLYYSGNGSGWFDDATFEIVNDLEVVESVDPAVVLPIEGGARGVLVDVGNERIALVTAGGPVQVDGHIIEHDGIFAVVSLGDPWRYVYLQEGCTLSVDLKPALAVAGGEPMTVAAWRDAAGGIHLRAQVDPAPHGETLIDAAAKVSTGAD